MKKRFLNYDAQGTDGADLQQMRAVFEVLDDDGMTVQVAIPATRADGGPAEDAALRAAVAVRPPAVVISLATAG